MNFSNNVINELFEELSHSIINIYKLCLEETGDDLGPTENEIDYHNFITDESTGTMLRDRWDDVINPINSIDVSQYKNFFIDLLALIRIFPAIGKSGKRSSYAGYAIQALQKYGSKVGLIDDKSKLFVLAQFIFESGYFNYIEEVGRGSGKPYGTKYYGRGPIQITWERNYKTLTDKWFPSIGLDIDIHKNPNLCCNYEIGCIASVGWFSLKGNGTAAVQAAKMGDIRGLTKAINGGYNGINERINITKKLLDGIN